MGKKANIITLRKQKLTEISNSKQFFTNENFIKSLKRCFDKKGAIITYHSTSNANNTATVNVDAFYTTAKITFLKKKRMAKNTKAKKLLKCLLKKNSYIKRSFFTRKTKQSSKKKLKKKNISKTIIFKKAKNARKKTIKVYSDLNKLFKDFFPNTQVVFGLKIVNKYEDAALKYTFNNNLNKFKRALFSRRLNLYYDFIKICSLFATKKITAEIFCNSLGIIFRFLQKRSHGKFLAFVKIVIATLIKPSKFSDAEKIPTAIAGIKMRMNGKLKGKLRASSFSWSSGKISQQTVKADADYSLTHIKTVYGCFGLKVWVNYKSNNLSQRKKYSKFLAKKFKKYLVKKKEALSKYKKSKKYINYIKKALLKRAKSIKPIAINSLNSKNITLVNNTKEITKNKISSTFIIKKETATSSLFNSEHAKSTDRKIHQLESKNNSTSPFIMKKKKSTFNVSLSVDTKSTSLPFNTFEPGTKNKESKSKKSNEKKTNVKAPNAKKPVKEQEVNEKKNR